MTPRASSARRPPARGAVRGFRAQRAHPRRRLVEALRRSAAAGARGTDHTPEARLRLGLAWLAPALSPAAAGAPPRGWGGVSCGGGPPSGRAGCYSRRWARRGAVTRAALVGGGHAAGAVNEAGIGVQRRRS